MLCAVLLWCVDGLSSFVIALIALFLHVDAFSFVFVFPLIPECDYACFMCSLLFKAVFLLV